MRRSPLLPLTIVLALATAVALLGAAVAVGDPLLRPAVTPAAGNAAVARRFYAAIEEALRTGDASALDAAASPDLVLRRGTGDPERGLDALRRHLAALRGTGAGFSLRVEEVVAAERWVVARTAVSPLGGDTVLGIPQADPATRGPSELLRIVDGRVVEYAGVITDLAAAEPMLTGMIEAPPAGMAWFGLARVTLPPGAQMPLVVGSGHVLYAVEKGTLAARFDGVGGVSRATGAGSPAMPDSRDRGDEARLGPGDRLTLGAGVAHGLRGAATTPTTVLTAAFLPAAAVAPFPYAPYATTPGVPPSAALSLPLGVSGQEPPAWPDGITVEPLIEARPAALPAGSFDQVRIAISRLVLAPGRYHLAGAGRRPTLLAVEAGRAILFVAGEPTDTAPSVDGLSVLAAGDATDRASVGPMMIHNVDARPLVVLVLIATTPEGSA